MYGIRLRNSSSSAGGILIPPQRVQWSERPQRGYQHSRWRRRRFRATHCKTHNSPWRRIATTITWRRIIIWRRILPWRRIVTTHYLQRIILWRRIIPWRRMLTTHYLTTYFPLTTHYPLTTHCDDTLPDDALSSDNALSPDDALWRHITWRRIILWRRIMTTHYCRFDTQRGVITFTAVA